MDGIYGKNAPEYNVREQLKSSNSGNDIVKSGGRYGTHGKWEWYNEDGMVELSWDCLVCNINIVLDFPNDRSVDDIHAHYLAEHPDIVVLETLAR